jgi:putative ABC transport system permease protein
VDPLQRDIARGIRPALVAIVAAVALLVAIACVNVTNLWLARAGRRRSEFAMRVALGAGRGRLVQQLLVESVLVAALGGLVGMAIAATGVRAFVALAPAGLPRAQAIGVDGVVFGFALLVTAATGVLVGLAPALRASQGQPMEALQHTSARIVGSHRLARHALVVAEVALAIVLLVGAGLLLRSLQRFVSTDPGFDAERVVTMQVSGRPTADAGATHRFFAEALDAARRVPGVSSAAITSQLPLSGDNDVYGVHFEAAPMGDDRGAFRYAASGRYLETLAIPLRRGRMPDEHDTASAPRVAAISESLALRRFSSGDPIGQRVRIGPADGPWFTIVGVVGDVKQLSLSSPDADAVYLSPEQWHFADSTRWLTIRAAGNAASLVPSIRQAIWSVDKDRPITHVATMEERLKAVAAERRFALVVFEAFGLTALVLAAVGICGVLSGRVAERTREIGVRTALGASRRGIVSLVLREAAGLTGTGAAIGLTAATVASQALTALLYGVSELDPVTYVGVALLLALVAMVAGGLPAWRAARIDPAITLRVE